MCCLDSSSHNSMLILKPILYLVGVVFPPQLIIVIYMVDTAACTHREGMAYDDIRLMVGTSKTCSFNCVECNPPLENGINFWLCLVDN